MLAHSDLRAFVELLRRTERQSCPKRDAAQRQDQLRIFPAAAFLPDLQTDLAGCGVTRPAANSYKDSEALDFSGPGQDAPAYPVLARWGLVQDAYILGKVVGV